MTERAMHTTRPFMSGRSQAIRIPKDYRLEDTDLVINQVGDSLVITPKASLQKAFFSGIAMLPDDFLSDGKPDEAENERISL
ncbi:MAG: AbrB/MazE/SpoVT family DNA-binding domain-containing protein [Clostridia bacterium]|nr:AbrB/MazE/SpoVT family DNA-binding domain-containing protein [Clostridia bacterium]MBQ7064713.1 AbrB/MazE/SpoVT family DNA-binding domain-containing protein [Bacillota bacterium]